MTRKKHPAARAEVRRLRLERDGEYLFVLPDSLAQAAALERGFQIDATIGPGQDPWRGTDRELPDWPYETPERD